MLAEAIVQVLAQPEALATRYLGDLLIEALSLGDRALQRCRAFADALIKFP
jgi:hypothetical protein